MENLIQFKNNFIQSINRLEAQMDRLNNMLNDRNEKTMPNTFFPIPVALSMIGIKNYYALETLTKIQFHHTNMSLTNFKP